MNEIPDAQRPQMLQVEHRDAIGARRRRVLAPLDGIDNILGRVRSKVTIQRIIDLIIFVNFSCFLILLKLFHICILLTKVIGDRRVFR